MVTGKNFNPPAFIAVMLRDIVDQFDKQPPDGESSCECCELSPLVGNWRWETFEEDKKIIINRNNIPPAKQKIGV